MADSEEEDIASIDETPAPAPDGLEENRRGRPVGKADQKPRYRRTAEQISNDKIKIAQMKLDALREAEERKLASKKTRSKAPRAKTVVAETAIPPAPAKKKACAAKPVVREDSPPPSPKRLPIGNRRQALYDSWFPFKSTCKKLFVTIKDTRCLQGDLSTLCCSENINWKTCCKKSLRIALEPGKEKSIILRVDATAWKNRGQPEIWP